MGVREFEFHGARGKPVNLSRGNFVRWMGVSGGIKTGIYMDHSLRFPGGSLEYVLLHILVPNEGIVEIPKNMIFKLEVIS
jgi:hypothetical protein